MRYKPRERHSDILWLEAFDESREPKLAEYISFLVEGSLNSKLPTIWRVEKQMKSR